MCKVSVAILNWNGSRLLKEYLPSVSMFTPPELGQVVVIDNGSTDESLQILSEEFPSVKVIRLDKNYGFADGYNLGIAQLDTQYVILLNDDVRVEEGWLAPLVKYMDEHSECGALQPKLRSDRMPEMFEYAGGAGGYLDNLGYPFCRGRIFDTIESDRGQYDQIQPLMWVVGACLMIRRDLYFRAGGLDSLFFAHMEEVDLCWRLRRLGYELVCVPESRVYHLGGASLQMGHPRKTLLNFRNSLLMLYKNLPSSRRRKILFWRRVLDGVAALNFVLHGEFVHAKAIWKAHRQFEKMKRDVYDPFKGFSLPENNNDGLGKSSILWQYYVRGRKHFSELKENPFFE